MSNIKGHVAELLKIISEGLWEKEHIISLGLLSCIAGESIFLLGPPGTAKSMVARRLKEVFKNKKSFEYLMSRFSTPDEIFGPVSISKLKNEDIYERSTEGYLPSASIVFLDEIWKAGPSIQNTLLTVINEKIYQNGNHILQLPMKGLIAASNELPAEDEGLEALWDRFLVRIVSNCISNEKTFYKMLCQRQLIKIQVPDELCITDQQYMEWQRQSEETEIGDEILMIISAVRARLKESGKMENVLPFDFYISDRRWKKIVHLLQVSAFLNGRKVIDCSDLILLYHVLWNKAETISEILMIVTESLFSDIEKQIEKLEKEQERNIEIQDVQSGQSQENGFKVYNYFYLKLINYPRGTCYFYVSDYKYLKSSKDKAGILYWDDNHNAYFIRCFEAVPFSTPKSGKTVTKVKLRISNGCLTINGQSYMIEKDLAKSSSIQSSLFVSEDRMENRNMEDISKLKQMLEMRESIIKNSNNLFVSNDELKLIKKHVVKLGKRIKELEIKAINLQMNQYGQ